MLYPVAEHFISINGEAAHAGELAAFIRFRGCNLNCSYCDTRWANSLNAPAVQMSAEELAEWVRESNVKNVTLTGGEPLLQENIGILIDMLMEDGRRVEIETNGSVPICGLAEAKNRPVFTMDYKLPSSGMEQFMFTDNFACLGCHDTVKFVVGSISDLEKSVEIMEKYSLFGKCHIYISPVFGSINPAEIVAFMTENGLNEVRLQLQLHKFIWEPAKRGV